MTGQWEAYLKRIQRGEAQLGPFLKGIEDYVTVVVDKVGQVVDPNELRSSVGRGPPPRHRWKLWLQIQ